MRDRVTRYEETHGALPESAVRSARSYYAGGTDTHASRLCVGTSCMLAGSQALRDVLGPGVEPVHCLGYCDRSPAVLRADGAVVVRCRDRAAVDEAAGAPPPPPPVMRCTAPESIVLRRAGRRDCSSLEAARSEGVYEALRRAVTTKPDALIATIEASGERGRGGAGFPAGRKWRACAESPGEEKYAIANGDEGDPGSFIDRVLMERDPHAVLEGLAICAVAVGASKGIVFIRGEYPAAIERMKKAVLEARDAGLLGGSVMGTDRAFDVTVVTGMGSYVCGEETAMLNAIEGRRGEVRLRPPYPTASGLHGRPTVVNNVETLVNVPWIITRGAAAYAALGTDACSGTKAMCLNHGFERPGIVEVEFGTSLRDVVEGEGGVGRGVSAIVLGGPMGSVLTPPRWDVPICYTAMGDRGIQLGHGGVVALPEGTDIAALLEHVLEFMQHESCGRCVPCRIGSRRALELARSPRGGSREPLLRLMDVMAEGSLCAFGRQMPRPMRELLELLP